MHMVLAKTSDMDALIAKAKNKSNLKLCLLVASLAVCTHPDHCKEYIFICFIAFLQNFCGKAGGALVQARAFFRKIR